MRTYFLWIWISFCLCQPVFAGGGVIQGDGTPTHNEEQELIHDLPALAEVKKLLLDLRPQYLTLGERFLFLLDKMSTGHVPLVHIKKSTPDQYAGYEAEYSSDMGGVFLISNLSYYFWDSFFTLPVQDPTHPERMSQVKVILHEMIHALLSFPELKTQRLTEYLYLTALGQASEELIRQLDLELESEAHSLKDEGNVTGNWIRSWKPVRVFDIDYPLIPESVFQLHRRALPGSQKKIEKTLSWFFADGYQYYNHQAWNLVNAAGWAANQKNLSLSQKITNGFGGRILWFFGVNKENGQLNDLCLKNLQWEKHSAQELGMSLSIGIDRSWWGSKITLSGVSKPLSNFDEPMVG